MAPVQLTLLAPDFPYMVQPGDDLAGLIGDALTKNTPPQSDDVIAVAQKIVSKAEGRLVHLATVKPSAKAEALAAEIGKDPRFVELVLSESLRVVRSRAGLLIVQCWRSRRRLAFAAKSRCECGGVTGGVANPLWRKAWRVSHR
jgi:coenzyme F420-0:L-glutamate ligase/coenzyme F420-1:gamma-L-glutamate ligase